VLVLVLSEAVLVLVIDNRRPLGPWFGDRERFGRI